jgi:Icc-related predicted phosphoesterase
MVLLTLALACPLRAQTDSAPAQATAATASNNLLAGSSWAYRLKADQPWTNRPPAFAYKVAFQARCEFSKPVGTDWAGAGLDAGHFGIFGVTLNDQAVALPASDMLYRELIIPASCLRQGTNVLQLDLFVEWREAAPHDVPGNLLLTPLSLSDLKFATRPVLGAADAEAFTVCCELNLPAAVSVLDAGMETRLAHSPTGTVHRLKVPRNNSRGPFVLVAANGQTTLKIPLQPPPAPVADKLTFVSLGDTQGGGRQYERLVEAAMAHRPQLLVRTGDITTYGLKRWYWDDDFFRVATNALTCLPHYVVPGNHDRPRWFTDRVIYSPSGNGTERNWSQRIGPALLIGIHGAQSFAAGSKNIQWLTRVLEGAGDTGFIVLFSHFPPVSSGEHTTVTNGVYRELTTAEASEVILPLLARHRATAYICGHDHFYERLEPEGGVTVLISGSGGAPQRPKAWYPPSSKVFASKHHYCLFEINRTTCTLRALTAEGEELDRKVWQARTPLEKTP